MNNELEPYNAIEYKKLITDDKITIIESEENGWQQSRILSGQELLDKIDDKLTEEIEEVIHAKSKQHKIQELAGFLILLEKMRQEHNISEEELATAIEKKVSKGQTYNKNIYLIKATPPPDGRKVNSAAYVYHLNIEFKDNHKETKQISSVTDGSATTEAKKILMSIKDYKSAELVKSIKL